MRQTGDTAKNSVDRKFTEKSLYYSIKLSYVCNSESKRLVCITTIFYQALNDFLH